MITIEEEDVAEALSKDHTIIFKGMQKEYPNTIYLYIEERKTVAAMQWLGILYTLDREGVVMKESTSSTPPAGMPVVTGFRVSNINVGSSFWCGPKIRWKPTGKSWKNWNYRCTRARSPKSTWRTPATST